MGPNLKNCSQCGRVFASQGNNLCSRCTKTEEDEYTIVRRYVRDHPGANVFEVAEETRVAEEKILRFLREGRLVSQGFSTILECERCGRAINSGRYCDKCFHELNAELQGAIPGKSPQRDTPSDPVGRRREQMHIKKDRPKL